MTGMRSRATGWKRGDARRQDQQTDWLSVAEWLALVRTDKAWEPSNKMIPLFPLKYSVSHFSHDFPFRLLLCYSFCLFHYLSVCVSLSLSLSLLVPVFECLNWRNSVVSNKISHGQDDKNSDSYDVSLQKWRQFLPATLGKDNFLLFLELFHNFFQRLLLCWVEK